MISYYVVVLTTRNTALAKSGAWVAIYGPMRIGQAVRNWKLYNNSVYGKSDTHPFVALIAETYGPHLEEKENKNG